MAEGVDKLCQHTLLLEHCPFVLVEEFLLPVTAAVEDHHRTNNLSLTLLEQAILHEGADRGNASSKASHDHWVSVIWRELESAAHNLERDLCTNWEALDVLGAATCLPCVVRCLPLIDNNGQLDASRIVEA